MGGFVLDTLIAAIGNTEIGVSDCARFALLIACALCGLWAYSSKLLPEEGRSAVAIFMAVMTFVFFELMLAAGFCLRRAELLFMITVAEILLLIVFVICAAVLVSIRSASRESAPTALARESRQLLRSAPQGSVQVCYVLPDMTDEGIANGLTGRNTE
jgi:hypothetical protein